MCSHSLLAYCINVFKDVIVTSSAGYPSNQFSAPTSAVPGQYNTGQPQYTSTSSLHQQQPPYANTQQQYGSHGAPDAAFNYENRAVQGNVNLSQQQPSNVRQNNQKYQPGNFVGGSSSSQAVGDNLKPLSSLRKVKVERIKQGFRAGKVWRSSGPKD